MRRRCSPYARPGSRVPRTKSHNFQPRHDPRTPSGGCPKPRPLARTRLYARVSGTEQTIEHQRTQAEQAGFELDEVVSDSGVGGVSTKLRERPQGRRQFDLRGDTLVVRWVDRLGRNCEDICETIREFMRRGVVISTVINGMAFDGATKDALQSAVRDALIAFMAATAQAQAETSKEAQRAGIAHARACRLKGPQGSKAELHPQAVRGCAGDAWEIRKRR